MNRSLKFRVILTFCATVCGCAGEPDLSDEMKWLIWYEAGGAQALQELAPCAPVAALTPGQSSMQSLGPFPQSTSAVYTACGANPWQLSATPQPALDVRIKLQSCKNAAIRSLTDAGGAGVAETLSGSGSCVNAEKEYVIVEIVGGTTGTVTVSYIQL